MAINTVSGAEPNQWQLISTNTTTSGTSSSFTGLSGYKRYMAVINCGFTSTAQFNATINGTSANYGYTVYGANTSDADVSKIRLIASASSIHTGYLIINDADKAVPKTLTQAGYYYGAKGDGIWDNTAAVTSISFTVDTAFTSGTIKLYGIPA